MNTPFFLFASFSFLFLRIKLTFHFANTQNPLKQAPNTAPTQIWWGLGLRANEGFQNIKTGLSN